MKQKILALCIAINTFFSISTAEKINKDTTWEELTKILESTNEQYKEQVKKITEQCKIDQQNILAQHENDSEVLVHVAEAKGIALNPDGLFLVGEQGRNQSKNHNKIVITVTESIRKIDELSRKNAEENLELLKKWSEVRKDKK